MRISLNIWILLSRNQDKHCWNAHWIKWNMESCGSPIFISYANKRRIYILTQRHVNEEDDFIKSLAFEYCWPRSRLTLCITNILKRSRQVDHPYKTLYKSSNVAYLESLIVSLFRVGYNIVLNTLYLICFSFWIK